MQLSNLADSTKTYQHIYLGPHLDDVVLSSGGAIIEQRRQGQRVLVVTLCTATPAPEGPFNRLAEEFHRFWALPPEEVVAARLREDVAAMERLDADFVWAGFLDAIYRRPDAYTTRASLFNTPVADDPLLPELIDFLTNMRRQFPDATIYAPLGVGFHVDHLLTHTAAWATNTTATACYEDVPYATYTGAVEARLATLEREFTATTTPIDAALEQKIEAIAAYASQMSELFRTRPMPEVITDYHTELAAGNGAVERVWR